MLLKKMNCIHRCRCFILTSFLTDYFLSLGTTLTKYYTFINFYYSALWGRPIMFMSKQKLEKLACVNAA